uniref:Serpin B3-like n=1 Tax=Monodon monoceros TaxID=40151 RepID=A0A8C6AX57_MONMO
MSSLGEGITHFAVDLFQQIRQSKKENIFYSPLSIMSAFAMTSLGARGHTASEIQKLEDQLTAEKLIEWTSPQNMNQREIELHLPQFKVEETYDLKPMLRALGMVDAFTEGKADFSGMSKVRELKVSEAFHKSFVEVNEEGTEATAVTGVEAVIRSAVFPESFHCDHPFLFLIKHNKINSLLFYGRVSSPEM